MKTAIVIGSGFGGLSTAILLAQEGFQVTVLEKNEQVGGRGSVLEIDGYKFDMGPSWYLMPEIFENFFNKVNEKIEDYLELEKLSPSYRIFFKDNHRFKNPVDVFSDLEKSLPIFEQIEPGCTENFLKFLKEAELKYKISLRSFLYKNYDSIFDFITLDSLKYGLRLNVFSKMQKYVEKYFKTPEMQKIIQYTLVFLGSSPYNTSAIYSLMTHVDFNGRVFFPKGGLHSLVTALHKIAIKNGVKFRLNTSVEKIIIKDGIATGVRLKNKEEVLGDLIVSNADMEFSETKLLDKQWQTYDQNYWNKKIVAPSGFIMYLGVNKKLEQLKHHTFVFADNWQKGFAEIFDNPRIPTDPSIYICNPNKSDSSLAPEGKENLFILVPIASDLEFSEEQKNQFANQIIKTIAEEIKEPNLAYFIETKQFFLPKDFKQRYHSIKGTALGLAHTLNQTGYFRPNNYSKKVKNLFYVGGNTNPGIGVPMCIISAELALKRIQKCL